VNKFKYQILFLTSIFIGTSANAQTGNFEGISVNAGGTTLSSSVKLSAGAQSADGIGRSSYAVDAGADYGLRVADRSVILVGGTYGLINPTIFKDAVLGLPAEIKFTRRWSVFAAPGITFGDSGLLYAKAAYISGKPKSDDFNGLTHSGYAYGVGARFMLTGNAYINAEFMQNRYGTKAYPDLGLDVSAKSTAGTLSLGFRF